MIGRKCRTRVRYEWGNSDSEALRKLLRWARGRGNVKFAECAWGKLRPFAQIGDERFQLVDAA